MNRADYPVEFFCISQSAKGNSIKSGQQSGISLPEAEFCVPCILLCINGILVGTDEILKYQVDRHAFCPYRRRIFENVTTNRMRISEFATIKVRYAKFDKRKEKNLNPKKRRGVQMLRNSNRNSKGFTLIELMIVVVIIGILAALAIPRFMRSTTKSKQSEAKQILKQVYTMQHAYRQEYNAYCLNGASASAAAPTGFAQIGVDIMASARYTYTMVAAANTFTCTATGNLDDDATNDVWTINEAGALVVTSDDSVG